MKSNKDAFRKVLVLKQGARYSCCAVVDTMTTYRPDDQQHILICRGHSSGSDTQTTIYQHWLLGGAAKRGWGSWDFLFFFQPWCLPHLNRCLSLETSRCYHRQYCISPYNILLHSTEPRWFINVRAKANMLCVLLELHKCLKSDWGELGCWSCESRGGWGRFPVLFPAWSQKSFFCSPSVALGRTIELIFQNAYWMVHIRWFIFAILEDVLNLEDSELCWSNKTEGHFKYHTYIQLKYHWNTPKRVLRFLRCTRMWVRSFMVPTSRGSTLGAAAHQFTDTGT